MKIQFKDKDNLKRNLLKGKEIIEELLTKDFEEKELNEENLKEIQEIGKNISKLHYLDFRGAEIKLVSSDGTELTSL